MSTKLWMLEKGLCRCCHAEGKFKNLAEPCFDSGQEEIYADMIKDCFLINIVPVPGLLCTMTYTICETCITRLRDAAKFKKNVAECEEKFKDYYNKNIIKVEEPSNDIKVKEELPESCQDDDFSLPDDDKDFDDFGFEDDDNKADIETKKKQKKEPLKPKSKAKSKSTAKGKKLGRPKKMKEEPIAEEQLADDSETEKTKEHQRPKFRLKDADYSVDGTGFSCTRCDKKYDKFYSLRVHVKTKHYKIPRYKCQFCKKEFMTPAPFTVHKLEEHNVDERFKCNACKGTFNTKVQLRKHINNFHMLGERYSCEFCEYESFSFESMYKHKFKHKTSKDHHCRFCRKAFVRKTTLALHERIHTGDRRKVCNVCGQAFVQKASLNYHMTKYHPEVNF